MASSLSCWSCSKRRREFLDDQVSHKTRKPQPSVDQFRKWLNSWRPVADWVAHVTRVLVSASRVNGFPNKRLEWVDRAFRKVRENGTLSPARKTCALPGKDAALRD